MQNGYYWLGDQIVKVEQDKVYPFHSLVGRRVDKIGGKFIGPICKPPARDPEVEARILREAMADRIEWGLQG
jgi:hypothetical protein